MVSKKDILIISELRRNARETLTNMSRRINLPISTIYDRMKMNEGSLIMRHTTLIDFSKIGFYTRANLMIKVAHDDKELLKAFLVKSQSINSVFKINNGFDFLAEGIFRQIKELEDFIDTLEAKFKIEETQVYYIVDELKREAFLADKDLACMLVKDEEAN